MRSNHKLFALLLCASAVGSSGCFFSNYRLARNQDGSNSGRLSRLVTYADAEADTFGKGRDVPGLYLAALRQTPPKIDIKVFNSSLPAGVHLNDGVLSVDPGVPLVVVGRFEIDYSCIQLPDDVGIRDDLARLASVTSADTAIIEVRETRPYANCVDASVAGFVLRSTADAAQAQSVTELSGATDTSSGVPRALASLTYAPAPTGCLSADEFADEVSAKLGYVPWTKAGEHRLAVAFAKTKDGYQGTVTLNDGRAKQVAGPTCKLAADALVVVTTVLIESN